MHVTYSSVVLPSEISIFFMCSARVSIDSVEVLALDSIESLELQVNFELKTINLQLRRNLHLHSAQRSIGDFPKMFLWRVFLQFLLAVLFIRKLHAVGLRDGYRRSWFHHASWSGCCRRCCHFHGVQAQRQSLCCR